MVTSVANLQSLEGTVGIDSEFSHIKRVLNESTNQIIARIQPGEYYVTTQDEMISTTLGSCISVCVHDTKLKIGGMNHYMLPMKASNSSTWSDLDTRYGNVAMERLLSSIFKLGGCREFLEIKVFGGAKITPAMSDIGARNIDFINNFLATENYEVVSTDVGLEFPRKVNYFPKSGKVMVKRLRSIHKKVIAQHDAQCIEMLEGKEK